MSRSTPAVAFAAFVAVLFLIAFPLSEMAMDYGGFWDAARDWARTFVYTGRNLGTAVLTLAIPSVLKFAYTLVKRHSPEADD